jgi:hypothetical protein
MKVIHNNFSHLEIGLRLKMVTEPILVTNRWLVMPLIVLVVGWQWNEFVHHVILVNCLGAKIGIHLFGLLKPRLHHFKFVGPL